MLFRQERGIEGLSLQDILKRRQATEADKKEIAKQEISKRAGGGSNKAQEKQDLKARLKALREKQGILFCFFCILSFNCEIALFFFQFLKAKPEISRFSKKKNQKKPNNVANVRINNN